MISKLPLMLPPLRTLPRLPPGQCWSLCVSARISSSSSGPSTVSKTNIQTDQKPAQLTSERFPGFHPVFVSPHIKLIRVACRLILVLWT